MFCLFFTEGPVLRVDDVKQGDAGAFRRFFWSSLDQGVYFAPSPYEAGFLSLAHSDEDIERTGEVVGESLKA